MYRLLLLSLLLPLLAKAQKEESFGKFIDPNGTVIRGISVTQYYERLISLSGVATDATQQSTRVRFTMETQAASFQFLNFLQSGAKMPSGEITVTFLSGDNRRVKYRINMEAISVEECADAGGWTTVQLHATRIGWTYYSYTRSGLQTISSKTGWDEGTRSSWTNF